MCFIPFSHSYPFIIHAEVAHITCRNQQVFNSTFNGSSPDHANNDLLDLLIQENRSGTVIGHSRYNVYKEASLNGKPKHTRTRRDGEQLEKLAEATGRTRSFLALDALRRYLAQDPDEYLEPVKVCWSIFPTSLPGAWRKTAL